VQCLVAHHDPAAELFAGSAGPLLKRGEIVVLQARGKSEGRQRHLGGLHLAIDRERKDAHRLAQAAHGNIAVQLNVPGAVDRNQQQQRRQDAQDQANQNHPHRQRRLFRTPGAG